MSEATEKIMPLLGKLAEEVMLIEPTDLPGLSAVHTMFQQLASALPDDTEAEVRTVVKTCVDQVAKIMMNEVPAVETLDLVAQALAALQIVFRDGVTLNLSPVVMNKLGIAGDRRCVLPACVDAKIFAEFLSGQAANMDEFEQCILSMDRGDDASSLAALRRLLHTLKGETGLLGIADIETLCSVLEDHLQDGYPREHSEVFFTALDWLRITFEALRTNSNYTSSDRVIALFSAPIKKSPPIEAEVEAEVVPIPVVEKPAEPMIAAVPEPTPMPPPPATKPTPVATGDLWRPIINLGEVDCDLLKEFTDEGLEYCENANVQLLNLNGNNKDYPSVDAMFRIFHTMKGVSGFLGLEEVNKLSGATEELLDKARNKTLVLNPVSLDVCFRCADSLKFMVDGLRQFIVDRKMPPFCPYLRELVACIKEVVVGHEIITLPPSPLSDAGDALPIEVMTSPEPAIISAPTPVVASPTPAPVAPSAPTPVTAITPPAPSAPPKVTPAPAPKPTPSAPIMPDPEASSTAVDVQGVVKETVRVDADRLDKMIDTIGELVIAESMVDQLVHISISGNLPLLRQIGQLGKITRELQEIGMSLRMMPIRATFQKMARLVRDVARKNGKDVELVMSGEDTELDKSLVDRIGDPLVHMIRNSVDHGIEDAKGRLTAEKSRTGRIDLRAYHKGGSICIEIADDGRGLNREAIIKKGIARGLITTEVGMTDNEIYRLIFEPGFSTAEKVTEISGRGVGMDVVKRNVEAMRGRVEIDTELGKGTSFVIHLPLTLAIIDGMVVRIGRERYIIPTLSILRSIQPVAKDIVDVVNKGEMLEDEGRQLPLFRLYNLLNTKDAVTNIDDGIALVVESDGRRIAIFVDEILEQQQTVIKSLGEFLTVQGIAGAAIMPDGRVGLIVDIAGLMEAMRSNNPPPAK